MSVWAIFRVKDEADVIERTVRRMLDQVDHVLVCDNASTDGTRELLEHLDVEVLDDHEVGYYQSAAMSRLAAHAAQGGAEWVICADADEVWYSPFGRIADVLREHPRAAVATAALYDHVATAEDDADERDPLARIAWRRVEPGPLPKVACRPTLPVTVHQGNHHASYPADRVEGLLVVRHFPYRSVEQFVSKVRNGAAAYRATDLPEHEGAHWRQYGDLLDAHGPGAIAGAFHKWFWSADPGNDPALIRDPCP